MDLENNTTSAGSTESTESVVETPPAKKPRRRVVRSAGTPAPVAAPESAPQPRVEPAAEAPLAETAAETAAAEKPASRPAAKTRSRKATRAVAAPDAAANDASTGPDSTGSVPTEPAAAQTDPAAGDAPADPAAGERAPEPKKKATRTRSRKSTPAPAEDAGSEEAPRRAASSRRRAQAADLDVIADLEGVAPAKKSAGQAKKSSRGARSTADETTETSDAGRPTIDVLSEFGLRGAETAAESAAPTEATEASAAPRKRAGKGRKATAAESSSEPTAAERPTRGRKRAEKPAEAPAAQPDQADEADGATGGRLATTALLFQAPEIRPRRRRASAPAGPPEAVAPTFADAQRVSRNVAAEDVAAEEIAEEADESVLEEGLDESATIEDAAEHAAEDTEDTEDEGQDEQQDSEGSSGGQRRRRRRGGRGRRSRGGSSGEGEDAEDSSGANEAADETASQEPQDNQDNQDAEGDENDEEGSSSSRRRRRRRRGGRGGESEGSNGSSSGRSRSRGTGADEVTALKGSTRLEAKRQRRREGRDAGRRRAIITEAEFLARRESVDRTMVVRERNGRTQIAVLEDGVLVEHYVSQQEQASMAGNVYLGRVQNVLPSMEAAFIDVGKGRNAVLYAGEVNWDAAGLEGQPRRIEQALKSGDSVLVQVTKDPIGHKGARLTSQVTLAGRYLVYVPGGGMTGISRKLPDTERSRLKKLLRELVPDDAGVIVRTAAEGASEEELRADITRLQEQWAKIEKKAKTASAPALLQGEPDLAIRVVRDIFNDDFKSLVVSGEQAWDEISGYVGQLAPDLAERVTRWTSEKDVFAEHRVDEQLAKGMDRKVWLPSGGSLVIDRTEAMTVVDVNTGKFTGSGGTLEETVTRNNLEAAEEIVRQLRLRDIGGIIVIDFIDMVLESNRDLVLRRLVECLGRDRTKHQVAEVTSLGLVQMTRKRVGQGLVEAFSETCDHCNGRGFIVHSEPNEKSSGSGSGSGSGGSGSGDGESKRSRRKRGGAKESAPEPIAVPVLPESEARAAVKATLATIAAAAAQAHESERHAESAPAPEVSPAAVAAVEQAVEAGLPVVVVEDTASVDEAGAVTEEVSVEDRFPGADGSAGADGSESADDAPTEPVVEAEPDAAPAAQAD